ncbi:MAG: glycoside hydrolase [Acidobacteriota bacterium]|nr:glycoside hydrolase [Acidobacteriota bacterium]
MKQSVSGATLLALLLGLPQFGATGVAQKTNDTLRSGFVSPPDGAKPRVWWHWMNGNITEEGIKLDLEWMHRAGLGGVTIFEGSIDTPQVVKDRLVYMTPGWKEAFRYATTKANQLGFEVAIASSPGWSATGGPWVPPSEGMKKMVWSETQINGGETFNGTLKKPSDASGTFQDFSAKPEKIAGQAEPAPLPKFYADSAVVAYRRGAEDRTQAELRPRITSSAGRVDADALSDGDIGKAALRLPYAAPGGKSWVQFAYAQPQTIQAVTLATLDDLISIFAFDDPNAVYPAIEASDDGVTFRPVATMSLSSVPERTLSFAAVTAKFFRIVFPTAGASGQPAPERMHEITELVLSSASRVNEFEKRAGFSTVFDYYKIADPAASHDSIVPKEDVIDLSSRMKPDGSLNWTAPAGRWVILRIGYSLTGHENGPAPAEATGLEVDKLNRQYVKNYVDGYLKTYADTVGPANMGKTGLNFMLSDSTEVGAQNWTDDMLAEFRQRRGYDAHPWLPTLTGIIIESQPATDRFLWDFRRTIAELYAQNHYGEIATELHNHHMSYYAEALEYHRPSLGDDMEMRRAADVPMGAMWTFKPEEKATFTYVADLRGAASIAHVYGQNVVGAESMTSGGPPWGWSPNSLKRIADLEFALGVNRFMIHESAHQPLVGKAPGVTLGEYGLWFNRNETWAEHAAPWVGYLSRSSYMLQQGHFFGDVAYFYGQEGPLTAVFGRRAQTDAPQGYGFDFVNADVVLNHLSLQNGRLVTPGGTSYRILYLGGTSRRMTLPVLRKIRDLVSAGAVVVGDKPVDSPSLADDQEAFHALADALWSSDAGAASSVHRFGKGRIYTGKTANEVLADLNVAADFEYTRPEPDAELMCVHRKLKDGDIYFVDNRNDRVENLDATFRVEGRKPELWHADTVRTEPASYRIVNGRTTVPLKLNPYETVFVVFRKPAAQSSWAAPVRTETASTTLKGPWRVSFEPNRGVAGEVNFDQLSSWSTNPDAGVKYFSGTATYTKTVQADDGWFKPGAHLMLDLGDVKELAEVSVNGKPMGIVWHSPFQLDVTGALHRGANELTIKVTDLWVNRLIGDQQAGATKYTFTTFKPYPANAPLVPSGLMGPVRVVSVVH